MTCLLLAGVDTIQQKEPLFKKLLLVLVDASGSKKCTQVQYFWEGQSGFYTLVKTVFFGLGLPLCSHFLG